MAYPSVSAPPMLALPTTIIGPQYCASSPLDLMFVRKLRSMSDGHFAITDVNGNIVFKVKTYSMLTLVLVDAAGNPITTFRRKKATMHSRWIAYRGESTDSKDLIFTVKKSSLFQYKTKLDVFLASNVTEDVCDFKVKGSLFEESCTVYAGESNDIVAQMQKQSTFKTLKTGLLNGKEQFMVRVYPNVDYAFIVVLLVILEGINNEGRPG